MKHDLEIFVLTREHIALLRRAYIGWQDCETGAPEIDPKRPYGNSFVALDVAEILKWKGSGEDDELTDDEQGRLLEIHRGTDRALEIILHTGEFRPGTYVRQRYGQSDWMPA